MRTIFTLLLAGISVFAAARVANSEFDLEQIIEKRASEVHWEQVCGGKGRIDLSAGLVLEQANAKDRLIAKMDELRAASKTDAGLRSTCRRIQKKYGLERH